MTEPTAWHEWSMLADQLEELGCEMPYALPKRVARPIAEIAATLLVHHPKLRGRDEFTVRDALIVATQVVLDVLLATDDPARSLLE
jgi:hypothetical protein